MSVCSIYVYTCIYVCMYVCMYVCVGGGGVCVDAWMCGCIHVNRANIRVFYLVGPISVGTPMILINGGRSSLKPESIPLEKWRS